MEDGWIKLHRKMREWQHYQRPSVRLVFEELLFCANTKPGWFHGIKVNRGETVVSIASICEYTGFSNKTVVEALKVLVETGEITRERCSTGIKTTILNFDKYQSNECVEASVVGSVKNTLPNDESVKITLATTLPTTHEQEYKEYKENNHDDARACACEEHSSLLSEFFGKQSQIETFCKNNNVTPEQLWLLAEEVINDWELAGTTHHDRDDMMRHLISTLRIKCRDRRNNGTDNYQKSNGDSRQAEREKLARGVAAVISRRLAKDKPHPSEVRQS